MSGEKRSNHSVFDGTDDTANVAEVTSAAEADRQLLLNCTAEAVLHPFRKNAPIFGSDLWLGEDGVVGIEDYLLHLYRGRQSEVGIGALGEDASKVDLPISHYAIHGNASHEIERR